MAKFFAFPNHEITSFKSSSIRKIVRLDRRFSNVDDVVFLKIKNGKLSISRVSQTSFPKSDEKLEEAMPAWTLEKAKKISKRIDRGLPLSSLVWNVFEDVSTLTGIYKTDIDWHKTKWTFYTPPNSDCDDDNEFVVIIEHRTRKNDIYRVFKNEELIGEFDDVDYEMQAGDNQSIGYYIDGFFLIHNIGDVGSVMVIDLGI